MQPIKLTVTVARCCAVLAALAFGASVVFAQSTTGGAISGRVQDSARGNYLNNARVTVEGTNLTAQTNNLGEFYIAGVPPGEARVTVFYSGLPTRTTVVRVAAGQVVQQDFDLGASGAGGPVALDAFMVSTTREMSDADMATNEQRFAPNMKTVLAADAFGDQTENNVAEFLKFMPALSVAYEEDHANSVSIRGMPAHTTIVTTNGNPIASAAQGWSDNSRAVDFEHLSINDVARVEINKSLLPDMPAEGIGGTINLIMKNSFERTRPDFRYRAFYHLNTTAMDFGKTPGPGREETYKIRPGFDFTYIKPVNRRFGCTIRATHTRKYVPWHLSTTTWNLNPNPATGEETPFVASISAQDVPKQIERSSGRIGADLRLGEHDVFNFGYSHAYYEEWGMNRRFDVSLGTNPVTITRDHVQGRPGAGSITSRGGGMSIKASTTWTPELKWTHHGPIWKFEGNASFAHASFNVRSHHKGFFGSVPLVVGAFAPGATARTGPTIRFDNTGDYLPRITTTLVNGESVDPRSLDNSFLTNATSLDRKSVDRKKNLRLTAQRTVDLFTPITIKAGGDVRQSIRDKRQESPNYTFLGPDGIQNSRDDAAILYGIVDPRYSSVTPPFGNPKFQWGDQYKVWDMVGEHPTWWRRELATELNTAVMNSAFLDETISSGFVRLDASFLRNRLGVATGVRYQRYDVSTQSGAVDNLRRYLQDEDGDIVLNPDTGQPIVLSGNALEIAQKTNIERGIESKRKVDGWYPSINAVYRFTENFYLRANFAKSINYPELNQLIAATNISDFSANPRRVTANTALEPWRGDNYDIDVEYYTQTGGSLTLAFFRKDISNFIRQATYFAGTPGAAAALTRIGYEQLIPFNYEVVQRYNEGEARLQGWEFAVDQRLDQYLPKWARGTRVFFNTSYKAAPRGVSGGDLGAFSQRLMNWGIAFRAGPFSTHLKWQHTPERKLIEPNPTATRPNSRTYLDIDLSYQFHRRMSFFATATNVMGRHRAITYVYTDRTPDYARARMHQYTGVAIVTGVKGQF
jgi:TonB-dependent receptor